MNEIITNELIEATYLFCVKRISDTEAAKDLSQDILCEALRALSCGKEFVSFYSWYWRMARNRYADYIGHKQDPTLPLEAALGAAADDMLPLDRLTDSEDIARLNFSLSRLANIHREMMIRFYLKEQPVAQIAEDLNIPVGTVKRRLFDAKKNLKERFDSMNNTGTFSYAPAEVNWFWGFNCGNAAEILNEENVIAQQVCVICRGTAKATVEIADEMGIAPLYLEPILKQMREVSLLTSPAKDKYITNFCVFPLQSYTNAGAVACNEFVDNGFCRRVSEKLVSLQDKISSCDFYGNKFDHKYLMWLWYVIAGDYLGTLANERYLERYKGKIANEAERRYRITMTYALPDEKIDHSLWGGKKRVQWSNNHMTYLTADFGKVEYVNDFAFDPFPNEGKGMTTGRDLWLDGSNIPLVLALAENPEKLLNTYEEEIAAQLIKNGVIKKNDNALEVQLPIFKRKTYREICRIIGDEMRPLAIEYADNISDRLEELLLPHVRRELLSNFIYWDMQMLFQPTRDLFYYGMEESDYLAMPEDYSKSAAGLYILTE